MYKIIGLTGGIASGKSTISKMIEQLGFTVLDADIASRKVIEPGEEAYTKVKEAFGEHIFNEDGTLNRAELGNVIFNNEEKRLLLNSIMHPAVRKWMNDRQEEAFKRGEKVVFQDIPLLFEGNMQKSFDHTILVYVEADVQLQRLMERNNFSKEEALARIRSQMPLSEKLALADEVINNNGTEEESKQQLLNILKKLELL
ncbi:dephospho-CoA kinase [Bacillus sp. AGMB 02131]|uniref:Dephospho-CoA kinase n=1 Tax=Peribacillus faecalis TaxID=2772559 RepID=A0A927CV27_9BACI|nr:dephospho-CoA kinase [Peribacillus faecalis]MBD3108348.1 dephospho-CoA kinase [Peribacillus faecalis]